MGRWEDFADIVNREWPDRQKGDSRHLLQLAQLAANVDQHQAMELTREAVRKAIQDPEILASAGSLAVRLGQDEEAIPWISESCRLSPPDRGPVKTAGMRELREILTASADRTRGVEEALSAARIPIHLAASVWKTPLTRLLVVQPVENERERDPRRRTVVPFRHGARGLAQISSVTTVTADITSLLLLAELDLLSSFQDRFAQVAIPWSTTEWLLNESHSCRFHQPSRVKVAKNLRELIANSTLRVCAAPEPPKLLVDEVGRELAELLQSAKLTNGRVVRPLPVHCIRSFMEQEADLGAYAPLLMTTLQFLDVLDTDAVIDHQSTEQARRLLASIDQREPLGPSDPGTGPLLLRAALPFFSKQSLANAARELSNMGYQVRLKKIPIADAAGT